MRLAPSPGLPADARLPGGGPRTWPGVAAGLLSAALFGILVSFVDAPMAIALTLGALGAMLLLVVFPAWGALVGIFVLYTNLPAAAARYGAIPEAATGMVGILFVPALVHHLVVRRGGFRVDRTFALMGGFLAVMLVSTAVAAVDVATALDYIGSAFVAEGMAVFLLVLNTIRDRVFLVRALGVVVAAAALVATLTVYQSATGNYHQTFFGLSERAVAHVEFVESRPGPEIRAGIHRDDRALGPVDEANRYAQILLVAACFALTLAWLRTGAVRLLALGSMAVILGAIFLTYSRGAFLTMVLLVFLLGVLRIVPRRYVAAGLVTGLLMAPVLAPGYVERMQTIAGVQGLVSADAAVEPDGATRGRTTAMLATLTAFSEHPILGLGPGQYFEHHSVRYQLRPEVAFRELPVPRRAHNLIVEIAADTGVLGLAFFLAIPGLLLRDLWRIRGRAPPERSEIRRLALGFILALLAYLGTGMFLHLAYHRYYWLLIGLSAAVVWILRDEAREAAREEARDRERFGTDERARVERESVAEPPLVASGVGP